MRNRNSAIVIGALGLAFCLCLFVYGAAQQKAANEAGGKVIDVKTLPAPVKACAEKIFGAGKNYEASEETEDGVTFYELSLKDDKQTKDILMTKDGNIAEIEESIPHSSLPGESLSALQKMFPGATIQKTESRQVFSYEVLLLQNGKTIEVPISADGKIMLKNKAAKKEKKEKKGKIEKEENEEKGK